MVLGNPLKFSRSLTVAIPEWPWVGEHTAEVLADFLDMDNSKIEELVKLGVLTKAQD